MASRAKGTLTECLNSTKAKFLFAGFLTEVKGPTCKKSSNNKDSVTRSSKLPTHKVESSSSPIVVVVLNTVFVLYFLCVVLSLNKG